MGNSSIRVYHGSKEILLHNSMMLENINVYINKKPSIACLLDLTMLLGVKYEDHKFNNIFKYYNYIFKKGNNQNLILKLPHKTLPDEFYI